MEGLQAKVNAIQDSRCLGSLSHGVGQGSMVFEIGGQDHGILGRAKSKESVTELSAVFRVHRYPRRIASVVDTHPGITWLVSGPIRYAAAPLIADILRLLFAHTESMTSLDSRHRVYMSFQCRNGWHCQFLEQDLKPPCPRSCASLHRARSSSWLSGAAGCQTWRAD